MTGVKKCRVCGNVLKDESLLQLPEMPKAVQNLPASRAAAVAAGAVLDVRQCSCCGLVQLTNEPVPYYKDVIRPGGVSASMRARQHDQFKKFVDRFSLANKNVIEFGSGRGEYLGILKELPVNAFGLEHHREFCEFANSKGLKTFPGYPTDLSGPPGGLRFDAFVSINVLEHAPEPGAFLRSAAGLLSENGVGLINVPDFEYELSDNYIFSFMSDHLSYFSADTLRNTLALNGLGVIEIFKNKELNVVAAYVGKRRRCDLTAARGKGDKFKARINDYLRTVTGGGGRAAVWGASHLAFSVIAFSGIAGKLSYIVDSSPVKQGRFSPAAGLGIFPPQHLREDPVNAILIMCPEYSAEIAATIKGQYSDIVQNVATFVSGGLKVII
ncbi:MAG: methyltransferase domain-containing protein [Candidatus Saganbacteria bacterium]|nr:methyltransferase domain-containing protein [Candidatus Saganbacteria bacterium]